MGPFRDHRRPHRLAVSCDLAPFILLAGGEQLGVQFRQIPRLRQRHPVVAPEVAGLAFNTAFFVGFVRRVQNSLSNRQWERHAMKRAVSSRRKPRRIFFTAAFKLSYLRTLKTPWKYWKACS
jgi:hypothetical protein